jgi:hypothetical protein
MAVERVPVFDEVYAFLTSSPSPAEIMAFRPSSEAQARIADLLQANREGRLSEAERRELDEFSQVEHFVRMLKIHAAAAHW